MCCILLSVISAKQKFIRMLYNPILLIKKNAIKALWFTSIFINLQLKEHLLMRELSFPDITT